MYIVENLRTIAIEMEICIMNKFGLLIHDLKFKTKMEEWKLNTSLSGNYLCDISLNALCHIKMQTYEMNPYQNFLKTAACSLQRIQKTIDI